MAAIAEVAGRRLANVSVERAKLVALGELLLVNSFVSGVGGIHAEVEALRAAIRARIGFLDAHLDEESSVLFNLKEGNS